MILGMAKKAKKGKAALRQVSAAPRKPKTEFDRLHDKRAEEQRLAWAKRNPDKAAEERRIRKFNIKRRADHGHKRNGTPETHAHAARPREGALSRLYLSGAIDSELLAAGELIALVFRRITSDVAVRTANLEPQIDSGIDADALLWEKLGTVRLEMAYSAWRRDLGAGATVAIAVIIDDVGIAAAARRGHMHVRRARKLLIDALELWGIHWIGVCRHIDEDDVLDAQAAIT